MQGKVWWHVLQAVCSRDDLTLLEGVKSQMFNKSYDILSILIDSSYSDHVI